jgi:hypothetical protein
MIAMRVTQNCSRGETAGELQVAGDGKGRKDGKGEGAGDRKRRKGEFSVKIGGTLGKFA